MTWEYRGLQGVTGGFKWFQGVRRGYRGLHGVTGGHKGLQSFTAGDKGLQRIIETFFLSRTFRDTFFWSILNTKSKLKKSQIFDQNHGLTPLENVNFVAF